MVLGCRQFLGFLLGLSFRLRCLFFGYGFLLGVSLIDFEFLVVRLRDIAAVGIQILLLQD